jgi:hypothetical protein
MSYRVVAVGAVAALAVVIAAGCGGGEDKESEGATTACKAAVLKKASGLPAAFPVPGELTLTQATKDGPTVVVDGYWTAGLDETYDEYKDEVEQAGYTVTSDEKEDHDAEINYEGSGRVGQIALKDNCSESDTTRVHITNRPA